MLNVKDFSYIIKECISLEDNLQIFESPLRKGMSSIEVCVFRSQNWKLSVRKQSRRSRKMPS